jgi:RNAse (barnase) inhibitor barstar
MDLSSLTEARGPWLHLLAATPSDCYDAVQDLERSTPGTVARVIRGHKATTLAAFYDEIAAALQFPPYFGANADALNDCLCDLAWFHAVAFVVCFLDADQVLKHANADETKKIVSVLQNVVRHWSSPPRGQKATPFHVVFQTTPEHAAGTIKHWRSAGLSLQRLN